MSTTASSLALPSLTHKTVFLSNPKPASVSLFSLSLSPLRLQCKPISVSASFLHSAPAFHSLSSRFVRNVAVSSEFDQEEDLLSDGDQLRFSPDLKLFVGNLPFSVDSAQLAGLFESAGNVEMVEVLIPEFGFSSGPPCL
jgi:nucleolin